MLSIIRKAKTIVFDKLRRKITSNYEINHRNRGKIGFVDVGSIGGLTEPWRSSANLVKFLLNFEPNESPMRGSNFMTYNTAVWESEETLPFYIYKGFDATGSSLFKQNYEFVRKNFDTLKKRGPKNLAETWLDRSQLVSTTRLKCRTLDSILEDGFPSTEFHFMKIDAQGAEYNILKGSQTFLSGSCIGLHLELFVLPLYEGIVLLDEVEKYLLQFGFRLVKKFPAHGTFDSQHDCLFLKELGDPELLAVIRDLYKISNKGLTRPCA
jgi:FkbM family methyltransferase